MISGRSTSGLWLGWSGGWFEERKCFLPSVLRCGQCCGFRREGMDHFIWMCGVPTAVLTLSLPPLATSKELELQRGLWSPVCKCACVCGREREMSWVLPYQLRISPTGFYLIATQSSISQKHTWRWAIPNLEFIVVIGDCNS